MQSSFRTAEPVAGEPLPLPVRREIHAAVRLGYTILGVDRHDTGWRVRFSGPRHMSSNVAVEPGDEADTS